MSLRSGRTGWSQARDEYDRLLDEEALPLLQSTDAVMDPDEAAIEALRRSLVR